MPRHRTKPQNFDIDLVFKMVLPKGYNSRPRRRKRAIWLLSKARRAKGPGSDEGLIFGSEEKAIERMAFSNNWEPREQHDFYILLKFAQEQSRANRGVEGGRAVAKSLLRKKNGTYSKKDLTAEYE